MASHNQTDPSSPVNNLILPTIKLDTTLSALYKQTCPSLASKRIGHIFCGTTCTTDLSSSFPPNKKFIYQDGPFNDNSRDRKQDSEIQQLLAPKYLSLIPQRDAFIAGPDPVIFFHSGPSQAEIEHDRAETERTLQVLEPGQRAEAIFCSGPGEVASVCDHRGIDGLGVKLVVDGIANPAMGVATRMLIDPDALWYVNGKEALARSGLPTPETEVVDVEGFCNDAVDCCETCIAAGIDDFSGNCEGPRSSWIREQTGRMIGAIERQELPFVFKNQQAFAGAGTYVVTNSEQRKQLIEDMTEGGIHRRLLCRITKENEHLRPGSILLMKMIEDPVADIGLTFFVGENGSPTFLAASEQMIDRESSSWIGSKISYPHQEDLETKFGPLIDRISSWLHGQGYFGPCGADILETKDGECHIVDLNVRTSGSLCLPLMRTHFTGRGLQCASSMSVTVQKSRDEFSLQWKAELESGQLCIVAWYEDGNARKSYGDIVVGAENEIGLSEMLTRVRDSTEQVTF